MTAGISACTLKNVIKMGEFLCSYFNIKDGRKKATFLAHYALLFHEGKNGTETQYLTCAASGVALWLTECVKGSLRSSCWRLLPRQCSTSCRPAKADSNPIKILIKNNQHRTTQETVPYSKYPHQALKIICTSWVTFSHWCLGSTQGKQKPSWPYFYFLLIVG